jgi:NAD(P)-dependent dehydrogenase (short-subunit alcohol dehydrogenase family)
MCSFITQAPLNHKVKSFHDILTIDFLEISYDDFINYWKTQCYGGFLTAKAAANLILERKNGAILFTGATASVRAVSRMHLLSVGKFGLRALAQGMAREFGSQGIHVAHVIVDGVIDSPRTREMLKEYKDEQFINPDSIANVYYRLVNQDRSVWSEELDLRTFIEPFTMSK